MPMNTQGAVLLCASSLAPVACEQCAQEPVMLKSYHCYQRYPVIHMSFCMPRTIYEGKPRINRPWVEPHRAWLLEPLFSLCVAGSFSRELFYSHGCEAMVCVCRSAYGSRTCFRALIFPVRATTAHGAMKLFFCPICTHVP